MATTPTDVAAWVPDVIASAAYDRLDEPSLTLTRLAYRFPGIEGAPGDKINVTTDTATTPADNLAVNVPAVDDKLTATGFTLTIKEAVKSIAWYDRTQVQADRDVNQLAGRKVGSAVEQRIELDLGAALVAGRNTAADATATKLDLALIRAMRAEIPPRLRRQGLVLVGSDDVLSALFDDATVNNAGAFGSDEALRNGELTRPLYGVTPMPVDDGVLPDVTIAAATGPALVMFARGQLAYGFQRGIRIETERDARARLTRHVGTVFHGEGVMESAGVVARRITG